MELKRGMSVLVFVGGEHQRMKVVKPNGSVCKVEAPDGSFRWYQRRLISLDLTPAEARERFEQSHFSQRQ